MDFRIGGTDIRDDDALWIQASGPITPDTPQKFRDFIGNKQNGSPKRIRFDSPGGNLAAGIELGYELRSRGFSTEVGRDEPHPDFPNESWQFTRRSPGECASACAYAFLGGVGRRVDVGSRLGFHQFYFTEEPTPQLQLSGSELSVQAQELAAILLSYIIAMGVDPSVLVFAGLTPQKEMFWLSAEDASMLGLTFEANAFRPCDLSP